MFHLEIVYQLHSKCHKYMYIVYIFYLKKELYENVYGI